MSSKFFSLFCLLLVALLVLPSSLHAQEDDGASAQSDEDISRRRINTEQNSAYVEADYIFPDHPNFELHAGERTQMLITLTNSGQHPYTVLYARGTLYFANDAQYSIENYTVGVYELTVNPSEQRSIQYYFTPHPMLDLSEYGLYTKIYYQDADGLNYTATVVNRTISIVEPENSYDADYLVRVGSTAAIIIIIAVIGWRAVSPSEAPKRRIELGTTSTGSPDDEWLAQTAAAVPVKKRRAEEASR